MLTEKIHIRLASINNCMSRRDASMNRLTSLGVGGCAELLMIPETKEALGEILGLSREHTLPVVFLGRGFNSLVLDGGVEGIVIALWKMRSITENDDGTLYIGAGLSHSAVTHFCITNGLSGLEFTCGIPGTAGGWIAMNAGIPESEVGSLLISADLVTPDGPIAMSAKDLCFHYRGVAGLPTDSAIVGGTFGIEKTDPERVNSSVRKFLAQRSRTQPLNQPSCGSVFKNPPGNSAGRLIEEAGLKGARRGRALISTKHANFIVTEKGATSGDVVALIDLARNRVFETTGILLTTEVRILGVPDSSSNEER